MRAPNYMKYFKCIGGACEDNCCIGWDVDIDKATFIKYQKVTHPLMQKALKRYVKVNPDAYSDSINYAFAVLTKEKHCSFLNADHLCMIHKHLGEDYLSNVCDSFPKITNKIDGRIERSATPSCPEVMRLLAESPEAVVLENLKDPTSTPIVSFDILQQDKRFKGTLISNLLKIRNTCLDYFESDALPLEAQLLNLSDFIVEIVAIEAIYNQSSIDAALKNAGKRIHDARDRYDFKGESLLLSKDYLRFSEMLINHLGKVGADDSKRYLELSKHAMQGDTVLGNERFNAFNQLHPHILRNLIKNHIFKNLFPFSEGENAEEALWLLLSRYAMIKRQLIGLAGYDEPLTTERVVTYLQVFSKVIEHHKHFETRTIETLKAQKIDSKKLIKILFIEGSIQGGKQHA